MYMYHIRILSDSAYYYKQVESERTWSTERRHKYISESMRRGKDTELRAAESAALYQTADRIPRRPIRLWWVAAESLAIPRSESTLAR
jgi:hypothetical protein